MTNKQIIRAAAERLDPATLHQIATAHHTPEEIAAVAASCKIVDKDGNEIPFDDTLPIPDGMEAPEGYQLVAVETGVSDANNTEIFWGVDEGATVYLNATPNTSNAVTDEENTAYNS